MKITREAAIIAAALPALAASTAVSAAQDRVSHYPVRDEIRRSIVLAPGAQVRLKATAGSVTVETVSGNAAELHIVRSAATQRDMDCHRILVETTASRIDIEHKQFSERPGCRNIQARQEVRLTLPRSVNIDMSGVAGEVRVASIDGSLRLNGIAGRTTVAGARSTDISGVAGPVLVNVAAPAPRDIDISGVAGSVELAFARNANADVKVSGTLGSVSSLSPDIRVLRERGSHHIRVGSGGPEISVSGTAGSVRVRRD